MVSYRVHIQATYDNRPVIPLTLRNGTTTVECQALIDSGADNTVFHGSLAQKLALDITQLPTRKFDSVSAGKVTGYEARIEIGIGDTFYPATVYFSDDLNPNAKNML